MRPHEEFLAHGAGFWRQLADGAADAKVVLAQGRAIDNEIDDDAAGWLRANEDAVQLGERARAFPEEDVVRGVTADLVRQFSTQASVRLGVQERFHGHYRSVALHAVRAWKRKNGLLPKVDENDNEDAQLPMHIGDEAFLATFDLNFIGHFDTCGTFQAPWLRTIGELLTAPLPIGKPWGKSARRAAKQHQLRDRSTLVQLEERVRTEFRRS